MRRLNNKINVLFKDAFFYYAGKIIPGIINLIIVPIIVRELGTDVYGEYTLYLNAIFIIGSLFAGWANQALLRFYSGEKNPNRLVSMLNNVLFISSSTLVPFLLIVFILVFPNIPVWNIIVSGIVILIFANYSFKTVVLQVNFKSARLSLVDSGRILISLIFILLLITINTSLNKQDVVLILIMISGISFAVGIWMINLNAGSIKIFNFSSFKASFLDLRPYLRYGLPLTIWFISAHLLNWSDRYIISWHFSLEVVGKYSAVYDLITKFMLFIFGPLLLALQPRIFSYFNNNEVSKAYKTLKFAGLIYLIIFITCLAVLIPLKSFILEDILGFSPDNISQIFLPILIGGFLWNFSMLVHKPLELKKSTLVMLIGVIMALSVNIVGNLIFIPIYGYMVAAYTTILGSSVYLVYCLIMNWRFRYHRLGG